MECCLCLCICVRLMYVLCVCRTYVICGLTTKHQTLLDAKEEHTIYHSDNSLIPCVAAQKTVMTRAICVTARTDEIDWLCAADSLCSSLFV